MFNVNMTAERLPHQLQVGDLRLAECIQDMTIAVHVSELVPCLRLVEHIHNMTIAVHVSELVSSNIGWFMVCISESFSRKRGGCCLPKWWAPNPLDSVAP